MKLNSHRIMVPLGIIGSFLTAFAFTYSVDKNFNLKAFLLPTVLEVAGISALIYWIIVYPLFYWCLKEKKLFISLIILYSFAILVTGLLNLIGPRESIAGAFVYWIVALLLAKKFSPQVEEPGDHGGNNENLQLG